MAGLFALGQSVQYVSIHPGAEALKVEKCLEMSLELPPSQTDVYSDPVTLEANLLRLKEQIGGRWAPSVAVGIQSRDVLIRVVSMPRMDLADARDAFRFEFDKYFPFPPQEAVYDLAEVDFPDEGEKGSMQVLVAASRLRPVETLTEVAQKVGMRLSAVEPSAVAFFRAVLGRDGPGVDGLLSVLAGIENSLIVVGYKDNGILFRNVGHAFGGDHPSGEQVALLARDIYSTLSFAGSQFRGVRIDRIMMAGYGANAPGVAEGIRAVAGLPVEPVDVWSLWGIERAPERRFGYEVALGLALRDLP
jgi:type IV pilus assembly protein PilM